MTTSSAGTRAATSLTTLTAKHQQEHQEIKLKHDAAHQDMIAKHDSDHQLLMAQHQEEVKSFERQLALEIGKQPTSAVSDTTGIGGVALLQGVTDSQPIGNLLDLLTEDPVSLRAFGQVYYVPPRVLMTSVFFQAKMQRWGDEELTIPTEISKEALGYLLRRLYIGCPVPVPDFNLAAQILSLAKLWLFDDIVDEIVKAVLDSSRRRHVGTLQRLSNQFDLPILKERADLLCKEHIGKGELMETIKSMAQLQYEPFSRSSSLFQWDARKLEVDDKRNTLYKVMLHTHPDKDQVLLDTFIQLPGKECAFMCHNPPDLNFTPAFYEFWTQLVEHGVMKKRFAAVSDAFVSKMHETSEFINPYGFARDLRLSGNLFYRDKEWCREQYLLMLKEAKHQLQSGAISAQILKNIVSKSDVFLFCTEVDESLESLVRSSSIKIGKQLVNVLASSLPNLPPRTVQALQDIAECT